MKNVHSSLSLNVISCHIILSKAKKKENGKECAMIPELITLAQMKQIMDEIVSLSYETTSRLLSTEDQIVSLIKQPEERS